MTPDVTPAPGPDPSVPRNGWWKDYLDVIPNGYQDLIAAEEDAEGIVHLHPTLVPGLLQTENYAAAITRTTTLKELSADEERLLVHVRMQRQRSAFDSARPKRLVFFLDEGCLGRPVGSPGTMREQLRHLLDVAARPDVSVFVLPAGGQPHPGHLGAFMVLENGAGVADVVAFEWQLGNTVERDPTIVRRYRDFANTLRRSFPDAAATHHLVEAALDRLPDSDTPW